MKTLETRAARAPLEEPEQRRCTSKGRESADARKGDEAQASETCARTQPASETCARAKPASETARVQPRTTSADETEQGGYVEQAGREARSEAKGRQTPPIPADVSEA